MIFELKRTLVKARQVAAYESAWADCCGRVGRNHVRGAWFTTFGVLNQVITLAEYADHAERRDTATAIEASLDDCAAINRTIEDEETEFLIPAPFSPALVPRQLGGLYEIRTYRFAAGSMDGVVDAWGEVIDRRATLSPLVFAGRTDIGRQNRWTHIWAYESLEQREHARTAAADSGVWPAMTSPPLQQESILAAPMKYSPLR